MESLLHSFVGSQRASMRLASMCGRPAMPLNFSAFTLMAPSKGAVNPKESPATRAKLSKKVRSRISTRW